MTLSEFRAWLDGFGEAIGETPTPDQWAKIKAKIAEVQDWPLPAWPDLSGPRYPTPGGTGDYPYSAPFTCTMTAISGGGERSPDISAINRRLRGKSIPSSPSTANH